jgi:hypothetical protein
MKTLQTLRELPTSTCHAHVDRFVVTPQRAGRAFWQSNQSVVDRAQREKTLFSKHARFLEQTIFRK